MSELVAAIVILIGLLFDLFGCIGLVRLPDIYNRVQASTKCVTLGTCMILIGVLIHAGIGALGIKALVCAIFILFTSPVAAHAVARGAHIFGVRLWEGSVIDRFLEEREGKKENRDNAD
jgi:multicomponent Na+:H+ antiporter subunit G